VLRDKNNSAAMSGFDRPGGASSATRSSVGISAAYPAIRGGVSIVSLRSSVRG
jgi:hypothetical protein